MNKIATTIEQNSLNIKLAYGRILGDFLLKTRTGNRDTIKSYIVRLNSVQDSSAGIAKYTVDNIVESMHQIMFQFDNHQIPSTSGIMSSTSPSSVPVPPAPEQYTNNNDDDENDTIGNDMNEIKILTTSLLESNTLQSLTRQSLFKFERLIADSTVMYEDYFRNGIVLDAIDCDLHVGLQKFIKIFEKYGPVRCVVTDVDYYADLIRSDPDAIASLPPTVRVAVVGILDLVKRQEAYTQEFTISPKDFNQIDNVAVKALLNRYSDYKPIKFYANEGARNAVVEVGSSTDEDDAQMTQTMRRKRKMRAAISNGAKSKRTTSDQTVASTTPATAAIGGTTNHLSDEAFIDNVKQMHKSNTIVPRLIGQIVNVVPSDVASSLLTCPTNGLGDAKVSVQNYNSTIAIINKMNLTAINENIYFYKLLEPLTYYGSSDALVTKVLWFVARTASYFINGARNFNNLRNSLRALTDDADRVALFMIRYNFLWFYRQFLDQLLSAPTTPYQNRKIINVLRVYAGVVQEEFNKVNYSFNQSRVYVGPVDNVIKLMVVSTSDILA
ncbi:virion capsid protein-80 [Alphabaculovirus altersperidaniae]|uniref:Virion capsid protein-80 n=1 Tax=Spodoptera eridania nucleopolyhedrovirus TaxID=2315721 RepID=A0ABX6TR82_9ABAC|nr:virion capsid protein-80 [Spodoptera eridania nucleopolyhedrovirus]QNV47878.1 virion capsid protein-80 [Spodoptera eridania nucleopolyhedrovirus]